MVSEEYLSHLKDRIRREVISQFFSTPAGVPVLAEHPLPPPIQEELRKSKHGRRRAKKAVLSALDFIIQNKKAVEERDAKELFDFNVIVDMPPSPDLEDRFIAELQRKVDEWKKRRQNLVAHSRTPARTPSPHPVDVELMRFLDPLIVMMLPRQLKDVLHAHRLHEDEEIRNKLQELQKALRTPPPHLIPERWLLQAHMKFPGYLDLLERSWQVKERRDST